MRGIVLGVLFVAAGWGIGWLANEGHAVMALFTVLAALLAAVLVAVLP